MGTTAKVFLGIVFFLSVVNLAVSSALYSIRVNWKERYDALFSQYNDAIGKWERHKQYYTSQIAEKGENLTQAREREVNNEAMIASKNNEITRLTEALAGVTNNVNNLTTQNQNKDNVLAQKDTTIQNYQNDISRLGNEIKDLNTRISSIDSERLEAQARLDGEKTKSKNLELENINLIQQNAELSEIFNTLIAKGIDVNAIVIGTAPPMEGRVLAVDPELNLVMISIGHQDKVKPGYHFYAHRNGEYIGEILIDKVETDAAFGHLLPSRSPSGKRLQIGDKVTTQLGG